uniref:COesterase domain-containing protein n=1 Tax=Syphacia muris TaxID=451379 RepID=A0A0N5AVS4_9BILA
MNRCNIFPVIRWVIIVFIIVERFALVCYGQLQQAPEPTRSRGFWNPFETTTTEPRRVGELRSDEVIVRLSIGNIVGKKTIIFNVPWTLQQDPLDITPHDRSHFDPDPLPLHNNVTISAFLGVPYAEPPLGQRRFKSPQLLTQLPGKDPFYAFDNPPACAQNVESRPRMHINDPYPYRVSEDCLYLNIYTPDTSTVSGMKFSVIVFFHGGNFQTGSINDWPGHVLASRGLVVVTVNYRLGPFGFMSLGDSETGNYGIQDQRAALRFVRDHISSFGGDPQAVTIVGHDAGAFVTDAYYVAPITLSAHLHSAAGSRTFFYVNNYRFDSGNTSFLPNWIGLNIINIFLTPAALDVGHECDLYLLFGFPFMPNDLLPTHFKDVKWSNKDRNASQLFTTIFRQFANNQNPNFPHDGTWGALEPRAHWYLNFNYTHWSEMRVPGKLLRDFRWKESAFWNEYIPSLVQFMTTTFSPIDEKLRLEVVAYQISIGIIGCILMLVVVLACAFAYLFFERRPRLQAEFDHKRLISDRQKREMGMKLSSL